jgi:hypothetical protein
MDLTVTLCLLRCTACTAFAVHRWTTTQALSAWARLLLAFHMSQRTRRSADWTSKMTSKGEYVCTKHACPVPHVSALPSYYSDIRCLPVAH